MFSIDNLIYRSQELKKEIQKIQQYLKEHSTNEYLVSRARNAGNYVYTKKYTANDGTPIETYLPVAKRAEAAKLAYNGYVKEYLNDLKEEKKAIDHYIKWAEKEPHAVNYLKVHPGHSALILGHIPNHMNSDIYQRGQAWKSTPYERSNLNSNSLKYQTIVPGLMVRSKAEADIISRLEAFGVAYHYEELFEEKSYNGFPIHLDFKCFNARTCKEFWWEHQGKWDDPNYTVNIATREKILFQAGLIPWKNLIITTETLDMPLDILWVDEIIKFFLL